MSEILISAITGEAPIGKSYRYAQFGKLSEVQPLEAAASHGFT